MILYSSIYYVMFLSGLLLLDAIFLIITLRTKKLFTVFFLTQLQFLMVIAYELYREYHVIQNGQPYPLTMLRVNALCIEYFIYGAFVTKVISYVETNWRQAFRDNR
jgi:hypothetical protein